MKPLFGSIGPKTRESIITGTIRMPGTTRNILNMIREGKECDNKEIQSHGGVMDNMGKVSESILLRVKNQVVSTLE